MAVESKETECSVICEVRRNVKYFFTDLKTFLPKLIGASIDSKLSSLSSIAD